MFREERDGEQDAEGEHDRDGSSHDSGYGIMGRMCIGG